MSPESQQSPRCKHGFARLTIIALWGFLATNSHASDPPAPAGAPPEAVAHWRSLRLGLFIHWGPVSLRGTEIGWSRGREVPIEEYDALHHDWEAPAFDPDAWAGLAREAGMRYVILTSKHHDGFCLWNTQTTDFQVMHSPFGRDVVLELSRACRAKELDFGLYYSICDWRHPDYPLGSPGGSVAKPDAKMERYLPYVHRQVEELLEGYGPLLCLWFDGEWEAPWTHAMGLDLNRRVRRLQPAILVNNRVDKGRQGMEGTSKDPRFAGDFWTPEQQVGTFQHQFPWETCMTLGQQWAWKPDDTLKSLTECLEILIATIGGDGNLLLNLGPMPDGRIEPRQQERLREIGRFVRTHAAAIYETRGGPFLPGPWGASTHREHEIFLFLREPAARPAFQIPVTADHRVLHALTLDDRPVRLQQNKNTATLNVPQAKPEDLYTVVRLRVDSAASEWKPRSLKHEATETTPAPGP